MIRRYQWQAGLTTASLSAQLPPGITGSVKQTSPVTVDIELLPDPISPATAEDIDSAMTYFGWIFREVDPVDNDLASLAEWNAADAILTAVPAPVLVVRYERQMLAYQKGGAVRFGYFTGVMDNAYDPQQVARLKIHWVAATAVAGDVRWTASFEKLAINGPNVDNLNFGAAQADNSTTNPVNGIISVMVRPLSNADLDTIQPGNPFRLRVGRQSTAPGDTMAGDAQLMRVGLVQ